MKKILLFAFLMFDACLVSALNQGVKHFVEAPNFKGGNLAVLVKDVKSGKVVLDYRSEKSLMPASNMKLITTATALELLGADFRFETPLEYDGTIDAQGVLHGNIYIVGTGDPTIGSEVFNDHDFIQRWVDAVQKAGIKTVLGHVVANVSAFDKEVTPPDWTWENMGNYFAAGVFGLSVYDNMYAIHFKTGAPGTTPQILGTTPPMYEMVFHNMLKAGKTGEDDDDGYLHGAPFSNERYITGTIPSNREQFSIHGDMPNPPLKLATLLTEKLNGAGVAVSGAPLDEFQNSDHHTRFFVHQSPTLAEIVKETNMQSNNLYAEHIFKRLALINNAVATRDEATRVVRDFWKQHGADVSTLFQHDGCGMSPMNGVSPRFFVELLSYMRTQSKYKDAFFKSLPVAGQSGTLKKLLDGTPLAGKVMAKSGSIRRVLCYSGYMELSNKEYAFSVMVNNYTGSSTEARKMIEQLLLSVR
ncbi:D-alanyl-D-alanine carboxypeptidase/D-alanyl-D-alanine-endopeptidase [Paludibacter sp.]|uniref:D-alanyl-D-alanine carboxypeptidase/D-alanyl-D-alanine endopeptidase n=1 Tax=Paludibacter sp. TaxID=1898105 RepID=UPI0013528779|nr:D-alanyl-D-alanine carboxypeptidase/D-alanyl-D-alanine-endopeptidase [Paludibacter sp.]MTK53514.1 D-alanyl-D-alanine carboxypeptidase/D-alanyl-D-alanine-endopeptidase [Paludibacter sp.]